MRGDWKDDAMQYRDLDRVAQACAEKELGAVMDGLAESVAELPDAEVLAEAREADEDTGAIAARVQAIIWRAAQTHDPGPLTRLIALAPRMAELARLIVSWEREIGDRMNCHVAEVRREARAILRELDGETR